MPWNHMKRHDCPFYHSQTCYVVVPFKGAHVLMVASLEDQQAPLPASALCTITLQAPVPPGWDAQRSPSATQQFPATAWKGKQDHDPHAERVADLGSSSSPKSGSGVEISITKCCLLQAWHLVQSPPNAEENALHFMTFGLDSPPLI